MQSIRLSRYHMKNDAGKPSGKPIDNCRQETSCQNGIASNPHVASCWVNKKFNFLYAGPQFIEHCDASPEQRGPIARWLSTVAVAFKQAHTKHVFKVGNHLRYNGFGNGKLLCRPRHALTLNDGKQNVQVAQHNAAPNPFRPFHRNLASLAKMTSYGL